jgi:hypothetical protein
MSTLADFFLADSDTVAAEYDGGDYDETRRAQLKQVGTLELSTLWAALEGVDWDADLVDDFDGIRTADGGGNMTHRLPVRLVELLATASCDCVAAAIQRWAVTEEMACTPADLGPLIGDLIRLSRAVQRGKANLYVWNCR